VRVSTTQPISSRSNRLVKSIPALVALRDACVSLAPTYNWRGDVLALKKNSREPRKQRRSWQGVGILYSLYCVVFDFFGVANGGLLRTTGLERFASWFNTETIGTTIRQVWLRFGTKRSWAAVACNCVMGLRWNGLFMRNLISIRRVWLSRWTARSASALLMRVLDATMRNRL
jgi:hypothetical protein